MTRAESLGPWPGGVWAHPGSGEAVDAMGNRPEIPRAAAGVGYSHADCPAGRGSFLALRADFPARIRTRRYGPKPRPATDPAPSARANIGVSQDWEKPPQVTSGLPKGEAWTRGILMAEAEIAERWRLGGLVPGISASGPEIGLHDENEPAGLMAA